ncbi:PH domain-containing protein [Nanoarchaeota archaeon]
MEAKLVLKPNLTNALLPMLAGNAIYSALVGLVVWLALMGVRSMGVISWTKIIILLITIVVFVVGALVPLIWKFVSMQNTTYYFYDSYLETRFEFVWKRTMSVPYDKIVNITLEISFWDRLCGAGDIKIHTAEDMAPDVRLRYIKNPEKIEKGLHEMMRKQKKL